MLSQQLKDVAKILLFIGVIFGAIALVTYGISAFEENDARKSAQAAMAKEQSRMQQLQSNLLSDIQTQNKVIGEKQDDIDTRITELKEQVQKLLP
jgi:DICT domain-containing protein